MTRQNNTLAREWSVFSGQWSVLVGQCLAVSGQIREQGSESRVQRLVVSGLWFAFRVSSSFLTRTGSFYLLRARNFYATGGGAAVNSHLFNQLRFGPPDAAVSTPGPDQ
jgi:hypothetical protein